MVIALLALVLCSGSVVADESLQATVSIAEVKPCEVALSYAGGKLLSAEGKLPFYFNVSNLHFKKAIRTIRVKVEGRVKGQRVPVAVKIINLVITGGLEPRQKKKEGWYIAEWTFHYRGDTQYGDLDFVQVLDADKKRVTEEPDGPSGYGKMLIPYKADVTWTVRLVSIGWYEEED